jgi:hypothetical protein
MNNGIGVWCCPICHGTGNIKRPHGMQKDMELKRNHAKSLRDSGYSIREICVLMGYKSPRSVQDLLTTSKTEK